MKWKSIIIGALAFYVVSFVISMATGPIIHEGVLKPSYQANAEFWRPELNQEPPDMTSLMPMWIAFGLFTSLVFAGLYSCCSCGDGPGWKRGMTYGLGMGIFVSAVLLGYSGIFNLPYDIWFYWIGETLVFYTLGGAVMGWAVAKWGD